MRRLPQILNPAPAAGATRPEGQTGAGRYVRSFLIERLIIGSLGVLLPIMTVLIDWPAFGGSPVPRDSLSAYYYSGMREWFVLSIGTTGFFLIAYKVTEKNLDNLASVIGGICAVLIAFFPTARSSVERAACNMLTPQHPVPAETLACVHQTALQSAIGEHPVQLVHIISSAVFIFALGLISILFGRREAERPRHGNRRSARFWHWFHIGCAGAIAVAGVWIILTVLTHTVDGPYWSLFAGETACTVAFGASWFAKGYEIQYVFGKARM
jgi:hypothetical protein